MRSRAAVDLSLLALGAVVLVACTPLTRDEDWPDSEEFDRMRVEPGVATPDACTEAVVEPTFAVDPDLVIDLERKDAGPVEAGQWLELRARMRNAGDATRKVPMPGDGSEVAWREPHVWWSAVVRPDDGGCLREVPARTVARCGLFDEDWQSDVVTLGAGRAQTMEWIGSPSYMLDLAAVPSGEVTMFLHAAYTGGKASKGGAVITSESLGRMRGESPFEVVSNPISFTLVRPLVLEARRVEHEGAPGRVTDLVALQVKNVGDAELTIAPPDSGRLRFEVKGETEESWPQANYIEEAALPAARALAPGASMVILGKGGPVDDLRYAWVHPKAETVKIRAYFRPYAADDKASIELATEWITVELE